MVDWYLVGGIPSDNEDADWEVAGAASQMVGVGGDGITALGYGMTIATDRPYNKIIKCKYCGKRHVKWGLLNGKHRLFNEDGSVHVCDEYMKEKK